MKTGVLGLGAMGSGMAMNLHRAGSLHGIWNRTRQPAADIADQTGTNIAESPEHLAAQCELVITCVSRDTDVKAVVEQMLPGVDKDTVVVDTSTVNVDTAEQLYGLLKTRGAALLDCPVSGGVEGAKKGTLAMMVGGDETVLERVRGTLSAIASNIVYMGPTGSDQATKAVNQIMAAGINQAVTEALAFGQSMGLPMQRVIEIVGSGAAANWFLDHRGQSMLDGRFEPGFKVNLHHKDLEICHAMARSKNNTTLPVTR